MNVSENIFRILKEKHMTQKEFSKRTGIAESTISDWKTKGNIPQSDKIQTICEALEISPYELLWEKETRRDDADVYIVDKTTDEGRIISIVRNMDDRSVQRILGYLLAMQDFNKDNHNEVKSGE